MDINVNYGTGNANEIIPNVAMEKCDFGIVNIKISQYMQFNLFE